MHESKLALTSMSTKLDEEVARYQMSTQAVIDAQRQELELEERALDAEEHLETYCVNQGIVVSDGIMVKMESLLSKLVKRSRFNPPPEEPPDPTKSTVRLHAVLRLRFPNTTSSQVTKGAQLTHLKVLSSWQEVEPLLRLKD